MSPSSWRRWMAGVILIALLARMGAVFALKRWDSATPGVNRQLAISLIETGSFSFREHGFFGPSSVTTPLYPILLATLFKIFGPESPTAYFAALTINAIFGALTAAVVATLVRRLTHRDFPGVIAGLLVALWPPQIFAATFAQPLVPGALCFAAACLLWLRSLDHHGLLTWIGFAVAIALSALIEPALALALPIIAITILCVRAWPLDLRVRNVTVLLLGCVLMLLPWVARNHAVHKQWLITTTFWQRVWSGANPSATGSDRLPLTDARAAAGNAFADPGDTGESLSHLPMMQTDLLLPAQRAALRDLPEVQREACFRAWAGDWFLSHQTAWLRQLPLRLLKLWWIDYDHPMSRNPLALIARTALALLSLAGGMLAVRARLRVGMPMLLLTMTLISAAMTVASVKQTILIEPLQVAVAITGGSVLIRRRIEQTEFTGRLVEAA